MRFRRVTPSLDLERQLRANAPEPRDEFVNDLVRRIDRERPRPAPWARLGVAVAVSGLVLIAIASFGGVGYAGSAAHETAKKVRRAVAPTTVARSAGPSSAEAQYQTFTPPSKKPPATKPAGGTESGKSPTKTTPAPTPTQTTGMPSSTNLPFTGTSLLVPLVAGVLLVLVGTLLRLRGRRPRRSS